MIGLLVAMLAANVLGEPCVEDIDCDSQICFAAVDDPRIHYCTDLCDPEDPGACNVAMACIHDGARTVCAFPTPTPTAQGHVCQDGAQCRSGLCDPEQAICVEPCDPAAPFCAEAYTCQASELDEHVCRLHEQTRAFSSLCGIARGGGGMAWIVAAAIALLALRPRRPRPRRPPRPPR